MRRAIVLAAVAVLLWSALPVAGQLITGQPASLTVSPGPILLYGTFTDASNYERLSIAYDGTTDNRFEIKTEAAGSGSVRPLALESGSTISLNAGSGTGVNLQVAGTTHWQASAANAKRIGANGVESVIREAAEAHTLAAAATSDTAAIIPANALVIGVSLRVTTEITGCATLDVGVAGATTRYGTGIALTAGTTNVSAGTTNPTVYSAATAIRFTCTGGGGSFTAGAVRVVVHYISLTAPTS